MGLRFFADHCVSNQVCLALREAGHEVLRLRDHIPTDSPDAQVISRAQDLDAILVSLNGDFADIVMYPPERFRGIISLQVKNHPEVTPWIVARLTDYLAAHSQPDHYVGKLVLVESGRIRIRG